VEFRGKMRGDKFPGEWAEFVVGTWRSAFGSVYKVAPRPFGHHGDVH
jgi:hypothetical protein